MLKVYRVKYYVSVDGGEWRQVGNSGYSITDKELSELVIIDNASFVDAREFLKNTPCFGVYNNETFFRHKPIIMIKYNDALEQVVYRNFNTLSYKIVYKEWTNVSMQWLIEHASADQCIQYLKERGMTSCPMNL